MVPLGATDQTASIGLATVELTSAPPAELVPVGQTISGGTGTLSLAADVTASGTTSSDGQIGLQLHLAVVGITTSDGIAVLGLSDSSWPLARPSPGAQQPSPCKLH